MRGTIWVINHIGLVAKLSFDENGVSNKSEVEDQLKALIVSALLLKEKDDGGGKFGVVEDKNMIYFRKNSSIIVIRSYDEPIKDSPYFYTFMRKLWMEIKDHLDEPIIVADRVERMLREMIIKEMPKKAYGVVREKEH